MADPLYRFPIFRTSDPEQLTHAALTVFGAASAELETPRDFEARANFLQLKDVGLAFAASSSGIVLNYPEADYVRFQIGLKGRASTIVDSEQTGIDEQQACITSSGQLSRMICDGGHERLTLRVNDTAIKTKLISLLGSKPKGKLEFESAANLNHPNVQGLWQLILFFAGQFDTTSSPLPPLALHELEQAITIAFLCANRHTFSHLLEQDVKDCPPWQVRRVEDYIEAHWNEAINIEVLVEITGVSARSIFQAFKRSRGYSPKAFAKSVRLKRAEEMLKTPDLGTSVTGVAFACGFTNLGHFAKEFHEAFGELPSEILARSKGIKSVLKAGA